MSALSTLGLEPGATKGEIKERWHALALVHHPDHGGEIDQFLVRHNAYKKALAVAHDCNVCEDTGRALRTSGFVGVWVVCKCRKTKG